MWQDPAQILRNARGMLTDSLPANPSLPSLSLADKAAQLIMIDVPGETLNDSSRQHLAAHAWNGVILFAKNVSSREQMTDLIRDIHANAKASPFLAIDQEGGIVDRARFPEMSLSPGLMALGAADDLGATYTAHKIMGRELKDLGIHIDFAPCLDVNNNPANPVIGVRSFGERPQKVAEHGVAAIRGLRDGGVAPTAKHFPGHGNTELDSHLALPSIKRSRAELEATELVPFRAAIAEKVEAIMTAHITFPALDAREGMPATLSEPILTGVLRQELGYEGVIVTDSLAMRALADNWGFAEATVLSVEAGADLILALGSFEHQLEALNGLIAAVQTGRLSEERLDESLARLETLRQKYHGLPAAQPTWNIKAHKGQMEEIVRKTITITRNEHNLLPLQPTPEEKVLLIAPDLLPQSPLGEVALRSSMLPELKRHVANAEEICFNAASTGPAVGDLARHAAEADYVVLALYARGQLADPVKEIAREVLAANPKTVVVTLSSPYIISQIPEIHTCVTGFSYTELTLDALVRAIVGATPFVGKLPIALE